jgi:hypothetical protein
VAKEIAGKFVEAGLTHVNMISAYKEPQLSFGGIKESGSGIPEAGRTGIEFFTEHKVAYLNTAPDCEAQRNQSGANRSGKRLAMFGRDKVISRR